MVPVKIQTELSSRFSFKTYCEYILSVFPKKDFNDLAEIRIVDVYAKFNKKHESALACYYFEKEDKFAVIEVNITNLIGQKIPIYLFEGYPEIASLLLTSTIGHELGHHVHIYRRNGVKQKEREKFADNYAKAGYFHYLKLREAKILKSYWLASKNIIEFDSETRESFKQAREELISWVEKHPDGIPFP